MTICCQGKLKHYDLKFIFRTFFEHSSPPRSPPPFNKRESRFEREQKIKVGNVSAYSPGTSGSGGGPAPATRNTTSAVKERLIFHFDYRNFAKILSQYYQRFKYSSARKSANLN